MSPVNSSIPPIFLAIVVWVVQLGVDAGSWSLPPASSWVLFGLLNVAVFWFAWVWIYKGLNWLTTRHAVLKPIRYGTQVVVPLLFVLLLILGVKLPPLTADDCAPDFAWRDEIQVDHHKGLDMPILIQFARLIPRSPNKFAMIAEAYGDDLRIFSVVHKNSKDDPTPYQLPGARIGYKATNPGFDVGFFVVAKHPEEVKFNIRFECLPHVQR